MATDSLWLRDSRGHQSRSSNQTVRPLLEPVALGLSRLLDLMGQERLACEEECEAFCDNRCSRKCGADDVCTDLCDTRCARRCRRNCGLAPE